MTTDEIDDAIDEVAQNPKKVKGDMGELEEHSIPDLIAARKHLANKDVVDNGGGFAISQIVASGP